MSLLRIDNLSVGYGPQMVIKDIHMEIHPGDFVGVLGPNGSGKTTLLRCISGVLKPASGDIYLEGKKLWDYSFREIARKLSVVPQGIEAGFEFSVLEFVTMGRIPYLRPLRGETALDLAVVRRAMELTGTISLADKSFCELSGGERQRVVIAQAIAQEPEILLLDEPASYLDISHEIEIFDLIRKLNREQNITVIVVLHDLNMALRYCKSLILLDNGKIFAEGTPSEVLTTDNIREVYNAEVEMLCSNGRKYIVPLKRVESQVIN